MSQLGDVYNNTDQWYPRMPPPASFTSDDVARFQRLIDDATGTRNGRPINKLAWAPDELRWYPYRMGQSPRGYTLPIFYYGNDANGDKVAVPRWVLLERLEPEQYAATWEQGRYSVWDGDVWDWKGPCPTERYIELRVHAYHDGSCCPCHGYECKCMGEMEHCWGHYLHPNSDLLAWVQQTITESKNDPEVRPTEDVRYFTAPQGQRDALTRAQRRAAKLEEERQAAANEVHDHFLRNPTSTAGLKRTESGLYLIN